MVGKREIGISKVRKGVEEAGMDYELYWRKRKGGRGEGRKTILLSLDKDPPTLLEC